MNGAFNEIANFNGMAALETPEFMLSKMDEFGLPESYNLLYSFNESAAPERHEIQYFEIFGNRRIYDKGWSAVTKHRTPWVIVGQKMVAFDNDVWELCDGSKDWSQAHDLSNEMPDMLHKLQRHFLIEASKYDVLPADDRQAERKDGRLKFTDR